MLLSGAGGDDLFTGYRRHFALRLQKFWDWLPYEQRLWLERISSSTNQRTPFGQRLTKLFSNVSASDDERLVSYFMWAKRGDLLKLFSSDLKKKLERTKAGGPMLDYLSIQGSDLDNIDKMLMLEQRFFLADHNLIYTDKMSMAAGVETRVPFLDTELVEFAATIPNKYKQKGRTGKWILKKAMEGYLPRNLIYRPKTGFGAPLRRWVRSDLRPLIADTLSPSKIAERGIFDPKAVTDLINRNDAGLVDGAYTIFSLVCVELWCERFLDK